MQSDMQPACYDYEDFFRRTRYMPEQNVIDYSRRLATFSDELVARHLKQVSVFDDGYELMLKCGLSVRVERR